MRVGAIVKLKRSCLGNPEGSLGVVYYNYRSGFQAIFGNGLYDGFNIAKKDPIFGGLTEADFCLEEIGFEPTLSNYQFKNISQVERDYQDGVFDKVLKGGNDGS